MNSSDFTRMIDMANRRLGGSVVAANDELFAERENLIKPDAPVFRPYSFGPKGQIMDGWESRRRREPGHDWAIVRLGLPGVVRGIVVDTSHFTGNYPPEISVEGTGAEGYPTPDELTGADWLPLVERAPVKGDSANLFPVAAGHRVTHVRLCQYPDGGVARLRVHGEPVADPRLLPAGWLDLAALDNGGGVLDCSNMFYSAPTNLISPGEARVMGEGWETARRRDDGNDWVEFALAGPGRVRLAELDTSHFVGNAPGWATLRGRDARGGGTGGDGAAGGAADGWTELLGRTRLLPDTKHRFRLPGGPEHTHVRLDIYPDGGMARVRLHGELSAAARSELAARWFWLMPPNQRRRVLIDEAGLTAAEAEAGAEPGVADRGANALPDALRPALGLA